jgi:protein-S-isoprenylcysteine O-methyltransferase Ste14
MFEQRLSSSMNWLFFTLHFLVFAVVHSVLASQSFKMRVFGLLPGSERFYRLAFNLLATAWTLVLWKSIPATATVLWVVPWPYTLIPAALMLFSMVGLALSVIAINWKEFAGIAQLFSPPATGDLDAASHQQLSTKGWYGRVRHPIYFFSMLFLLAKPTMTLSHAIVCVFCGVYFYVGAQREEWILAEKFGAAFTTWKRQVPLFFPRLKRFDFTEKP